MKKPVNNGNGSQAAEKKYAEVRSFQIRRTHIFDNGIVVFDMQLNDVCIYGCKVMTVRSTNEDFISFPQRKGSDGKYYNICSIYLSPEDTKKILQEVERILNE